MITIGISLAAIFWVVEAMLHRFVFGERSFREALFPTAPNELWMRLIISGLMISFGVYAHFLIARIKESERKREALHRQLEEALGKALGKFIPTCANCGSVRDSEGRWLRIEEYVRRRTDASFTHTICEACGGILYPETMKKIMERR